MAILRYGWHPWILVPTWCLPKGQLISKANCQAVNSSKKQTNEFVLLLCDVFSFVFGRNWRNQKNFWNYLTFSCRSFKNNILHPKSYQFCVGWDFFYIFIHTPVPCGLPLIHRTWGTPYMKQILYKSWKGNKKKTWNIIHYHT